MIIGKDIDGNTISESLTLGESLTLTGDQEFSRVDSITVSGLSGGYVGAKLEVGVGGNVQIKKGAGFLGSIIIGETAAGAIKIIDGTSGDTVNIGQLKASIVENTYKFCCQFAQGLRIILAAANKITVTYR